MVLHYGNCSAVLDLSLHFFSSILHSKLICAFLNGGFIQITF